MILKTYSRSKSFRSYNKALLWMLVVSMFVISNPNLCASDSSDLSEEELNSILKKTSSKSYFEENLGQWSDQSLARAQSNNLSARFYEDKVSFVIQSDDLQDAFVYNMKFKNHNSNPRLRFVTKKKAHKNYIGCVELVSLYQEIRYENLYKGIDLRFYVNEIGKMEFDFIVHPNADPNDIQYALEGVDEFNINKNGSLSYCSPFGLLGSGKTVTYQSIGDTIQKVASNYKLQNNSIGFDVPHYDQTKPLIIDPTVLEWSTYIGGLGAANISTGRIFLDGADVYLCGEDRVNNGNFDYPTTPGSYTSTAQTNTINSMVISRFDTLGNLIFSTYLPMENGNAISSSFALDDHTIFFSTNINANAIFSPGISASAFDTNRGLTSRTEIVVGRLDNMGQIIWSTFLGGEEAELAYDISVSDGVIAVGGFTESNDFPLHQATTSTLLNTRDHFLTKFDYDGNVQFSSYLGIPPSKSDINETVITRNGYVAVAGRFFNYDSIPVTQTPPIPLFYESESAFLIIYDQNNQVHYATQYDNQSIDIIDLDFEGNQVCLTTSQTGELAYTTPGAYRAIPGSNFRAPHIYCVDLQNADLNFASYIDEDDNIELGIITIENEEIYYAGTNRTPDNEGSIFLKKFDPLGNLVYYNIYNSFGRQVKDLKVVNGSSLISVETIAGQLQFSPTPDAAQLFPRSTMLPTSFLMRTDVNGNYNYGTWISGDGITQIIESIPEGDKIYVFGVARNGFPTTVGAFQTDFSGLGSSPNAGSANTNSDYFLLRINNGPCIDDLSPDNIITPPLIEVCMNGTVPFITGEELNINEDSLKQYLIDGVLTPADNNYTATYQWQINFVGSNIWIDISGATNISHQPSPLSNDANFRRIVTLEHAECYFSDTSNIALVDVNEFFAPALPPDEVYFKCATSQIPLDATATGGTPPYTYIWAPTNGLDNPNIADPSTNVSESVIYNVEVTDANGCIFIEQYAVRVYEADAGDEKINCIGTGVQIGTPHVAPGQEGFKYFWTPTVGLSSSSVAQPIAFPSSPTLYTLSILGPDNCIVSDDVLVNPIQTVADAGSDVTYCFDGSIQIGEPNDPDYTFIWNPGLYLNNQTLSNPTVSATEIPNPNPYLYTLTKVHNQTGCTDTDSILVYVNRANAGIDFCGPRFIGVGDHSNGQANFTWTVLSGDAASIVGQENLVRPYVSPNQPTTYRLDVEWNGVICTDIVVVPECGCLIPDAEAYSDINCPVGDINYNTIIYSTSIDTTRYNYLWTPATGIPDPTNPYPQNFTGSLTSPATYTLTSTLKANSNISCASSVIIYPPPTPFLFAHAVDKVTCIGEGVNIGGSSISGWTATWSPDNGTLNQINSFDPIASPDETSSYIVVIEENVTECQIRDTAIVEILEIIADAGEDKYICENSVVQLGTEAIPGLTYSWEPSLGLENSDTAQPIDTLFATTTFYLTVSDVNNTCLVYDTVTYTVVTNPIADAGTNITTCEGGSGVQIGTPEIPGNFYAWEPQTGLSDPNIAQPFANPSTNTTYTLTVSNNAEGCFSTDAIIVEVAGPESIDAGPDHTLCLNEQIQIGTPSSGVGYIYEWAPINGLDNPNIAQPIATVTDTITYTLSVTAPSGCIVQDQVVINLSTPIVDAGPNFQACENEMYVLGTPGLPNYSYSWNPTIGLDNPNIAQPTHTASSDIMYTLTATDENNCEVIDQINITVQNITADAGPDNTVCNSGVQIGLGSMGSDYTYSWTPSNTLNNPNIATPTANPSFATTYTLTITHVPSGCMATDQVLVTPTTIADAGPNKRICLGETVQIGNPAIAGTLYSWSPATGLSNPNIAQPIVDVNSNTNYTLTTSFNGCTSIDNVLVEVVPLPVVSVNSFETICSNECIQIGATENSSYRYNWSPVTGLSNPNIPNPIACPTETTTYTLEVTSLITGCKTSVDISVSVSLELVPNPQAGPDKYICPGETTNIGYLNQNTKYTYSWSPSQYVSNPFNSQTQVNIPSNEPGEYEYILTASDNNSGCEGTDTVSVIILPIPNAPILTEELICQQSTYTLCDGCVSNNNHTYSWSPSNGVENPDSLQTNIFPESTTTYTLLITDNTTGCTNTSTTTISVNDNVPPFVSAGPDQTACINENISLGIPSGSQSYTWYPASLRPLLNNPFISNPIFTPDALGEYMLWIEAIDSEGCSSLDTVNINVLEDAVYDAGTSFFTCSTEVDLEATINNAEGLWVFYSGPSDPVITDPDNPITSVTNLVPGEYKFAWTVNSSNVCNNGDFDLVTIQVYEAPSLNITHECTILNNQSNFYYSISVANNGLPGTYNISGFDSQVNLSYSQVYGPFGPFLNDASSYNFTIETSFDNCADVTEVFVPACIEFDFGDLPDTGPGTGPGNYETLSSNNGPSHTQSPQLYLAYFIDSETEAQQSIDALGDGEDEDAFKYLNYLEALKGANYRLPFIINNQTSQTAYLKVWADWNADGDFDDLDELLYNMPDNGNGSYPDTYLDVLIPDHAIAGTSVGLRARLSQDPNITPYGDAGIGEVEDYLFDIIENDSICLPLLIVIESAEIIQN